MSSEPATTGPITPGKTAPKGGGGRDPIPVGKHLCRIRHVEKSLAKTGSPRLAWQFEIVAGSLKNRIIFDDTYLTESSLWKVQSLAAAAGLKAEESFDPDKPAELIEKFQGRQLWVTLAEDVYTNKDGVSVSGRKVTAYDSTVASMPKERERTNAASTSSVQAEESEEIPF